MRTLQTEHGNNRERCALTGADNGAGEDMFATYDGTLVVEQVPGMYLWTTSSLTNYLITCHLQIVYAATPWKHPPATNLVYEPEL